LRSTIQVDSWLCLLLLSVVTVCPDGLFNVLGVIRAMKPWALRCLASLSRSRIRPCARWLALARSSLILPQGIRTSTATVGPSEKSCQTLSSGPPSALFPWPIHHQSHCCHCPRSKIQGTHLLHYVYFIRSAMRGGQGHIQSDMPAILLLSRPRTIVHIRGSGAWLTASSLSTRSKDLCITCSGLYRCTCPRGILHG
jgi:hypothetical protein